MIKVLTMLISYSTKRRHKRGVHSYNTSSDFAFDVSFCICILTCFYFKLLATGNAMNVKYIVFLDTSRNITNKVWQTTSIGNKSLRGLLKQTIIMINFNMTLKIKLSFFFFCLFFCFAVLSSKVSKLCSTERKK